MAALAADQPNTELILRALNADLTAQLTVANTVAQAQTAVNKSQQKAEVAHKAAMDLIAAESKKCASGEIDVQTAKCKPEEPKKP